MDVAAQRHLNELVKMGFDQALAQRAVEATGGSSLSLSLDWLTSAHGRQSMSDPRTAAGEADAMLAKAIEESLNVNASSAAASVGFHTPYAALTEDEELRLVLSESLAEEERTRRISRAEVDEAMAAMEAVPASVVPSGGEPEPEGPMPEPPAAFIDDPAEAVVLRRLERRAPEAMVIAKAAVLLRRRAAAARMRALTTPRGGASHTLPTAEAPPPDPFPLAALPQQTAADPFPRAAAGGEAEVRRDGLASSWEATGPRRVGLPSEASMARLPAKEAAIVLGRQLLHERLTAMCLERVAVRDDVRVCPYVCMCVYVCMHACMYGRMYGGMYAPRGRRSPR